MIDIELKGQKIFTGEPNDGRSGTQTAKLARREGKSTSGIMVGTILGLTPTGDAVVEVGEKHPDSPLIARTMTHLTAEEFGREAVLAFESGDLSRPIVLGVLGTRPASAAALSISSDGQKIMISAEREIELRCGGASITLTRAGKIVIKGEYVLTRAKGVNRIRGAAVQIN